MKRLILTFDGGGVLGIGPAAFMSAFVRSGGVLAPDAVAGTSAGAILAACRAVGMPWRQVVADFQKMAPEIFTAPPWRWRLDPRKPKYDGRGLVAALRRVFGDTRVCNTEIPIFITAMDYTRGRPKVWDSGDSDFLWYAVAASCSAPTYFPPIDGLVDGGLVANSPAMVALAGAVGKLRWGLPNCWILSMGTNGVFWHDPRVGENTSLVEWMQILLKNQTRGNEEMAEYQARTLLEGRLYRVEPVLTKNYPLDAVSEMAGYRQLWEGLYRARADELVEFLTRFRGG